MSNVYEELVDAGASTTQLHELGYTVKDPVTSKLFRYVQCHASSTSAIALYSALYLYAPGTDHVVATNPVVTFYNDIFYGVGIYTIAKGSYGFVQVAPGNVQVFATSSGPTMLCGAIFGCTTDKSVLVYSSPTALTTAKPIGYVAVALPGVSMPAGGVTNYSLLFTVHLY